MNWNTVFGLTLIVISIAAPFVKARLNIQTFRRNISPGNLIARSTDHDMYIIERSLRQFLLFSTIGIILGIVLILWRFNGYDSFLFLTYFGALGIGFGILNLVFRKDDK